MHFWSPHNFTNPNRAWHGAVQISEVLLYQILSLYIVAMHSLVSVPQHAEIAKVLSIMIDIQEVFHIQMQQLLNILKNTKDDTPTHGDLLKNASCLQPMGCY